MAVILYSNGIVEQFMPEQLIFTEEELVKTFFDYKFIKTRRLDEIPNCWCIWGEIEHPDPIEFNKLCSDMFGLYIFSHVIFVHDSELNPDWNLTDNLYKNYQSFKTDLNSFIDATAARVIQETEEFNEEHGNAENSIYLSAKGHTTDKRVIYMFNPSEQTEEFYSDGAFTNFSDRIYDYLSKNFKKEDILTIFSDTKVIIAVEKKNVEHFFHKIINNFQEREQYEVCSILKERLDTWKQRKKRGRPKRKEA